MWKSIASLSVMAILPGYGRAQQASRLNLRGTELGMTLEAFKMSQPPVTIPAGNPEDVAMLTPLDPAAVCSSDELLFVCHWEASTVRYPKIRERLRFDLGANGSVSPNYIFFGMLNSPKLMEISAETNIADLESLLEGYTQRYGPPKTSSHTVQNSFGAQFTSSTITWTKGSDLLVIETRCDQVDTICIKLTDVSLKKIYLKALADRSYKIPF